MDAMIVGMSRNQLFDCAKRSCEQFGIVIIEGGILVSEFFYREIHIFLE